MKVVLKGKQLSEAIQTYMAINGYIASNKMTVHSFDGKVEVTCDIRKEDCTVDDAVIYAKQSFEEWKD